MQPSDLIIINPCFIIALTFINYERLILKYPC